MGIVTHSIRFQNNKLFVLVIGPADQFPSHQCENLELRELGDTVHVFGIKSNKTAKEPSPSGQSNKYVRCTIDQWSRIESHRLKLPEGVETVPNTVRGHGRADVIVLMTGPPEHFPKSDRYLQLVEPTDGHAKLTVIRDRPASSADRAANERDPDDTTR